MQQLRRWLSTIAMLGLGLGAAACGKDTPTNPGPPPPEGHVATIGGSGGTFEITDVDHPYRGLRLTVPPGTLAGSTQWRFSLAEQPTLSLPSGFRMVGPALEISTSQARGSKLMTLEIPVSPVAPGELMFAALHDPVRGVTEVLPIVERTATTVVTVTSHLRGDLILGPTPAQAAGLVQPSGSRDDGVARVVMLAIEDMEELLTQTQDFTTQLNKWPVRDHGSAAYPDGMSVGITMLQLLGSFQGHPAYSSFVKGLAIDGFYAEAGPLAAAQMAQHKAKADLSKAIADLAPMYAGHAKPLRDALVLQNIVANARLTGRSTVLAGVASAVGKVPMAAAAVSGSIKGLVLRNPAEFQPSEVEVSAAGLGTIELPLVADGAQQQLDDVVPLSSFVMPFEELNAVALALRQLGMAATEDQRDQINRQLAAQAGLPDIILEMQDYSGSPWVSAGPVSGLVQPVRDASARLRLVGRSFSAHGSNGAELARSEAGSLSFHDELGLDGEPEGTPVWRTISAFTPGVAEAIRQVAVAKLKILRVPFEVEPEEFVLEGDSRTAEFEAPVDHPPADGFQVEWDWGDGVTTVSVGQTAATHEYENIDDYVVVATLKSSAGDRKFAIDTVKVRGDGAAWVGTVTSTTTHTTTDHTKVVRSNVTNVRFERTPESDATTTRYKVVSGNLSAYNDVACANYVSPTVHAELGTSGSPQWLYITKAAPPGGGAGGGSSIWYRAHGSVQGLQLLNKVCPTDTNPEPEAYVFQTGVVWLYTYSPSNPGAPWMQSTDPNVIEGSFTRNVDNEIRTWTWRFEKD